MRKEIFACISLVLVLCMLVGCAGRKGAEGGYRDDSIGDAGLDGITNGKKKGSEAVPDGTADSGETDAEAFTDDETEYSVPDESCCGDWYGHSGARNGSFYFTLKEPDELGVYQIEASFNWRYSDSGNGMFVDTFELSAEAVVTDGVMTVSGTYEDYSGTPESERTFQGELWTYDEKLRLVVLECRSYCVHPGDQFDVRRQ